MEWDWLAGWLGLGVPGCVWVCLSGSGCASVGPAVPGWLGCSRPTTPFHSTSSQCSEQSTIKAKTYGKSSRYNARVKLQNCAVCGYTPKGTYDIPLDTHHIHEQRYANAKTGLIDGRFHKNKAHNLVALCKPCHQQVDAGTLLVHGYIYTTSGEQLSYSYVPSC